MDRGKPSKTEKLNDKNNRDFMVSISITIPHSLLMKIRQNIHGENVSQKISKCSEEGYKKIMEVT